jgi:hypothetical protein|tara:strand:- start:191 stop:916 length:726 start_codon:yes stop_codon:yes gene_type:complete
MKNRHELPNFKKIHVKVDVDKILKIYNDNIKNLEDEKDHISTVFGTQYVSSNNYDQYLVTEYDDKSDSEEEKDLTNEKKYTKLSDWVKGTYIEEVLNMFESPFTRSRFCVIKPGGFILPHMDYNTNYSVRYQIPIQSNDWSFMGMQRKGENPEIKNFTADGSTWFFNPGWKHSAWNMGDADRIHLVICVNGQWDLEEWDEMPNLHHRVSGPIRDKSDFHLLDYPMEDQIILPSYTKIYDTE